MSISDVFISSSLISPGYYDRTLLQGAFPAYTYLNAGATAIAPGAWSTTPPTPTITPTITPTTGGPCSKQAYGGSQSCGDPIEISTGNVFEQVADYATQGQNRLSFVRAYNSQSGNITSLGPNWRSNYDRLFTVLSSTSVGLEAADGQGIIFNWNGSAWQPPSNLDYSLTHSGSGIGSTWTLVNPADDTEVFTQNGSTSAELTSITARNGYAQNLAYSSGLLQSVTDSYSRTLSFTYTGRSLTGLTTPDSLVLTYVYDTSNRLQKVSYSTSPVASQIYLYENTSFPHALTGITDENGNRFSTWNYDTAGRATCSENGGTATCGTGSNLTTLTYNSGGTVTVTDPLGVQTTYTFIPNYRGEQVIYMIARQASATTSAATRYFSYDANGFLSAETDYAGWQTHYTRDSHGQATTVIEAYGTGGPRTTTYTYHSTFHVPLTKVEDGLTTTYAYDSYGNLLTKTLTDTTTTTYSTSGQKRIWTYTYNSTGQLLTVQRPIGSAAGSGYKTTYGYTGGTLTSITDALSHATTISRYTGGGLPLTLTDANSVETDLTYDSRLRLHTSTLHTAGGNRVTTYDHDAAGNLTKITPPDNAWFSFAYDNAHRLTSMASAGGYSKNMMLDAGGHVTQTLWKDSGGTTKRQHSATFDAIGNMLTDVAGAGQTTTYAYDTNNNPIRITDPLSHATGQAFDVFNRLFRQTDVNGDSNQTNLDLHGRTTQAIDKFYYTTNYVYDGFGDVIQERSPDRGTTVYTYDKDGNMLTKVDAVGNTATYAYDQLDRQLTRVYTGDASLRVTFTYDQAGHGKGIGRLTSIADQAGTHSRSYDERGAITTDARTIGGTTYTTTYAYNAAGKLSSTTYPGAGWTVAYARDGSGDVSGVTATPSGGSPVTIASSIVHLPFGPYSSLTWGNGVTGAISRDLDYRMTHTVETGTSAVQNLAYTYTADNNLSTITDAVSGANSATYCYDSLDRITGFSPSASAGCGSPVNTYTYDKTNNRTSVNGGNDWYNGSNTRFVTYRGGSVAYNADGNITNIAAVSSAMTYNKAGQAATILAGGNGYTYAFDAFGQRLTGTQSSYYPRIYQYGLDGLLLMETDGGSASGIQTDYVYLDGTPIAAITPSTSKINYIHTNHIGAPTLATNASKAVSWSAVYDPFGGTFVAGSANISLRMPGQFADNTGLYHNGARDYDPAQGRYIQYDPIGMEGGLAGGFNTYVYAADNSLKNIDPTGLNFAGRIEGQEIGGIIGEILAPEGGGIPGEVIGGVIGDWATNPAIALPSSRPPGYWDAVSGAGEWGRRNGISRDEARRRFHRLKQNCKGASPDDNFSLNPETGDVIDPNGESVGNLEDEN